MLEQRAMPGTESIRAAKQRLCRGQQGKAALGLLVTLTLSLSVLSGCGVGSTEVKASSQTNPLVASNQNKEREEGPLKSYYQQKVTWKKCESGMRSSNLECATIKVPIDYENPQAGDFQLALNRVPAGNTNSKAALVINPGGPGGSGIDFLKQAYDSFPKALREGFDLVGFDPRGVNKSSPLDCLDDRELDEYASTYHDLSQESGRDDARKEYHEFFEKCLLKTKYGDKLKFLGTKQVIQDLDIIRAVLQQPKLSYLGLSYGSQIGLEYANMFSENVGRFVLDGVVDPSMSEQEIASLQAKGFEKAFDHFVQTCVKNFNDCPFDSETQARDTVTKLLNELEKHPMRTGDQTRKLTRSLAETAIIYCLYSSYSYEDLAAALASAIKDHRGNLLLDQYDKANSRRNNGHYEDNSTEALQVINNLDYPVSLDESESVTRGDQLIKEAPLFGRSLAYVDLFKKECSFCQNATKREPVTAKNLPPIILLGGTQDPATPYVMAKNVHKQLSDSVLITVETFNHTAFFTSGRCVVDPIKNYFLYGEAPKKKEISCEE